MKNKIAYRMMLQRLNSKEWEEDNDQVVKEVQRLSKIANSVKSRPYAQSIVVFQDGEVIAKGTSGMLSKQLNINSSTIRKRAERNFVDTNGRQFKFETNG